MREFLKGLELDKETIDTIMAEHGKYITEAKEEISNLKEQVQDYKSKSEESEKSLENLQNITNENKDLKAQIKMNESNVKKEFSKFVTSEVMSKVSDDNDFAKALEDYKKENPQYFGDVVVKKVQSSPNLNNGGEKENTTNDIMNDIIRSARK